MDTITAEIFEEIYDTTPAVTCRAPGRVTLFGGQDARRALSCATGKSIYCAARPRDDGKLRFYSENLMSEGVRAYAADDPVSDGTWCDYPRAMIRLLADRGVSVSGADFAFHGDLPIRAGLASSAALEVLSGLALCTLFDIPVSERELILLSRTAQSNHPDGDRGLERPCACVMSQADHLLLLDTDTMHGENIPFPCDQAELVVIHTGERIDLTAPDESERATAAAQALRCGDLAHLGALMTEAHRALRDKAGACRDLNLLTEAAWATKGVLGARMIGCSTVNLVERDYLNLFIKRMSEFYEDMWDEPARITIAHPSDGACAIN